MPPTRAPAPVTLVIGPEELLADRALTRVVDQARAHAGSVNVREMTAAELVPGVLAGELTPSLFDDFTVLLVTSLTDAPDTLAGELASYASAAPGDGAVILRHSGTGGKKLLEALRATGKLAEFSCAPVKTRRDKLAFLKTEFRDQHRKATDEAIEYLLDAVGGDLRALVGAASQLVSDTTGLIDAEAVRRYYTGRAEVSGFVVADRALEGRLGPALEQLRWAVQSGTDPVLILSALASGLRTMLTVASMPGASPAKLAQAGVPSWKVDALRRQVRGWTPSGIETAFAALARADLDVKSGEGDPGYALERAVLTVVHARTA